MHLTIRILPKNREKVIHSAHTLAIGGVQAAYFAPHPAGWYFYPIGDGNPPAWVNAQPCLDGKVLSIGDTLRVGSREMVIDSWDLSELDPVAVEPARSSCQISTSGAVADERQIDGPLLIGTAPHCHLVVPLSSGLDPTHLLVSRIEGRWILFDLSGRRIAREDEIACLYLYLLDGDRIRVGELDLNFWIIFDNGSQVSDSSLPGFVTDPDDERENSAGTAVVPILIVDAILTRCIRLARDIQHALAGLPQTQPLAPGSIRKRFTGMLGGSESPDDALDRFARVFRKTPADRQHLMEFVRFTETQATERDNPAFLDLARIVCKELVQLSPGDGDSLMMLVQIHIAQGRLTSRTREQRLMDYDKANSRLNRLLPAASTRPELVELQRSIAAERTIVQGNLDR